MFSFNTILCPTDFSEQSTAAFHLANSLAKEYQARLVLVSVKPPTEVVHGGFGMSPPEPEDENEALKSQLMALQPDDKTLTVEHFYRQGEPGAEIVRLANEVKADLIVMGTHGRGGLSRMLMGSVAEHVMRHASCPVVTVKQPVASATLTTE